MRAIRTLFGANAAFCGTIMVIAYRSGDPFWAVVDAVTMTVNVMLLVLA